jgi:hypothetical protein
MLSGRGFTTKCKPDYEQYFLSKEKVTGNKKGIIFCHQIGNLPGREVPI